MLVGVCFSTGDHKDSPQCLGTLGNLDLFFLLIRTFSLDPLDHPHCDLPPRSPPVSSVFLTCNSCVLFFARFKGQFHVYKLPL